MTGRWPEVSCACVGDDTGILLCMEQKAGNPAPEAVRNYLEKEGGIPGKAVMFRILEEIPRRENGKTDYPQLKALQAEAGM